MLTLSFANILYEKMNGMWSNLQQVQLQQATKSSINQAATDRLLVEMYDTDDRSMTRAS